MGGFGLALLRMPVSPAGIQDPTMPGSSEAKRFGAKGQTACVQDV
jgi:hypothetical protein